jgi:hypothetical protein
MSPTPPILLLLKQRSVKICSAKDLVEEKKGLAAYSPLQIVHVALTERRNFCFKLFATLAIKRSGCPAQATVILQLTSQFLVNLKFNSTESENLASSMLQVL